MASALALRNDFTAARMRALSRSSCDAQGRSADCSRWRRYTRAGHAARRRGLAVSASRRFAIGSCGSTPRGLRA